MKSAERESEVDTRTPFGILEEAGATLPLLVLSGVFPPSGKGFADSRLSLSIDDPGAGEL